MTSCKEAIKDIEIDGKVAAEVRAPPAAEPHPEAVVSWKREGMPLTRVRPTVCAAADGGGAVVPDLEHEAAHCEDGQRPLHAQKVQAAPHVVECHCQD